jgi:hypothetical protein
MYFPVIEDYISGYDSNYEVSISIPNNVAANELLLIYFGFDDSRSIDSIPSG